VPGVLAAGGVFLDQNGAVHGSDYASGYKGLVTPIRACGPAGATRFPSRGAWIITLSQERRGQVRRDSASSLRTRVSCVRADLGSRGRPSGTVMRELRLGGAGVPADRH
jgi:hypothetical protein